VLTDVLAHLRCPVCGGALAGGGQAVHCPGGHSFDLARHGYLNLTAGRATHPGDSSAMVAARAELLETGAFDFVSEALAAAAPGTSGLVVDAGAGTGHHLAAVLTALPGAVGLALDVSKPAVRRAARAHPRLGAVLADNWRRLPVADRSATVLLNVFAPRNGAEFARILRSDGTLLVVTPTAGHLVELVRRLGLLRVDPDKTGRVAAGLAPWFHLSGQAVHTHRLRLSRTQVRALVGMGPSARHLDPHRLAAVAAGLPEPVPVTAEVRLARYHLRRR
jgi:23S rRNA (guanine745-N1)-methyltransferase